MSALLHSFFEASVWDRNDARRPNVNPVTFRVVSLGKIHGRRVDGEFVADFNVLYDPDDDYLLSHLPIVDEEIAWGKLVYWRRHETGEIDIIDPQTDEPVGRIVVRRRMGGDPSGETDWTNVVRMIGRGM